MTPEQRKDIRFNRARFITLQYRDKGKTMREIGEQLGISASRVGKIIKDHTAITTRPRGGYRRKLPSQSNS